MPEENKELNSKDNSFPGIFEERKIFGRTLIKFIESIKPKNIDYPNHPEDTEDTRVISIDADWGFGKTTFINVLKRELEKKNFTVFTYNAWENDLEEDPLASFVRAIIPQIISAQDENFDDYKDYQNKMSTFISVANSVIKLATEATPIIPSIDLLKIKKEIKENKKEVFNNESVAIKCAMEISQTTKLKNDFINALDKITPKNENKIIVLIDELDRCNPTFAIELLERIKHFFNSNKYLFIFTINSKQLISSVKKIYGDGFKESGYFRRFFDYEFYLPQPDISEYFEITRKNIEPISPNNIDFIKCVHAAIPKDFSLRDYEKINKSIKKILIIQGDKELTKNEIAFLTIGLIINFLNKKAFVSLFVRKESISISTEDSLFKKRVFNYKSRTDNITELNTNISDGLNSFLQIQKINYEMHQDFKFQHYNKISINNTNYTLNFNTFRDPSKPGNSIFNINKITIKEKSLVIDQTFDIDKLINLLTFGYKSKNIKENENDINKTI